MNLLWKQMVFFDLIHEKYISAILDGTQKVETYKDHMTGTRHVGTIHRLLLTALLLGLLTSDCFMEMLQIHILFIPTLHKLAPNLHVIEMGNRRK